MSIITPVRFFLLFLLIPFCSIAQNFEFLGVIKLNDSSFISYKLVFDRVKDSINGYSLTDFAGKHETKSNIKGFYNEEENILTFKEYDIIYTKSTVVENDFCFVNFSGKLRNLDRAKAFSGDFKGLYSDGQKCLDGMIIVNDAGRIAKRVEKIDRKIQRSRRFSDSIKENISARKILDTLNRNIIAKGENLNIFSRDQEVKLKLYDAGKEDGDRINLFVGGEKVLSDYTVTKEIKQIQIPLNSKSVTIRIEAINVGSSAPNTVRLEIEDSQNFIRTLTNLDAGEKAEVTILKK